MRTVPALVILGLACLLQGSCAHVWVLADVDAFVARRDQCEHFRGESPDPPDEQRMAEVNAGIARYCSGTDKQLAGLRRKYTAQPDVLSRLGHYEAAIEAD